MAETPGLSSYEGFWNLTQGSSVEMMTQVYHVIFAATAIASPAFGFIRVSIHPEVQRIFVTIRLRWWARLNWWRCERMLRRWRARWLQRAERNCREVLPAGYRLVVFYEVKREGRT